MVGGSGFFTAFRMTEGARAHVILRSKATKNPKPLREYYIYILTNETHRLYVGVTGDLQRRMYQHKHKLTPGFASRYNLRWLVYYETTTDVRSAIAREKQIKGWKRYKKVALIVSEKPYVGRPER